MPNILSRTNSHKTPRKSSSFLSLRREKEQDAVRQRPQRPHTAQSSPNTPSFPEQIGYPFPSVDNHYHPRPPATSHSSLPRTRTRTATSNTDWDSQDVPQLRFSNSSSTHHTETPPRTPEDYNASSDSLDHFPVLVAAPVAGVETMDALVDGMNGGDPFATPLRSSIPRNRFPIPGHHPLYQPPLPTPPPGIVLGGGTARRTARKPSVSDESSDDDYHQPPSATRRKKKVRPSSRSASSSTIIPPSPPTRFSETASISSRPNSRMREDSARSSSPVAPPPPPSSYRKSAAPSISEIIRNHPLPETSSRSRPPTIRSSSLYTPSTNGHATLHEEVESEPEPLTREEEAEFMSRSSIDSVADEVQRTIRRPLAKPIPPPPPPTISSFLKRHSTVSDNASSIYSPRSDPGAASIYSVSAPSSYMPSSPYDSQFLSMTKPTQSQGVAQYLRSTRLTTLLKLTRSPHASADNPLTVSLSDLGNPQGYPVVVFLGLGCVRHIMGLYDEMADCLGLRLITIDRWGLGRTEPRSKSAKGIIQWASVVEEVLDLLHIDQCSIMAHSAGAPYALSFANKNPSRIRGDVCLLAPWVGGSDSNGYKWLKYVPNGILKTAQAAEWKIQAWMIGKPPTVAYEGIGYTAPSPPPKPASSRGSPSPHPNGKASTMPPLESTRSRPSCGSSSFSEYDDLRDFDGRFESRETLGRPAPGQANADNTIVVGRRKVSRGILDRLKGSSSSSHPVSSATSSQDKSNKRLKGLRSMGSLKGKSQPVPSVKTEPSSPQLPPSLHVDVGLGLEEMPWAVEPDSANLTPTPHHYANATTPRSHGRRSISFTSSKAATSMPSSPVPSTFTTTYAESSSSTSHSQQVMLGNALIAASHAESAKGTHNDLLQILNHENHSWGFSYGSYPHNVKVWFGDKDEKIAENAVRWMERTMGTDKCSVKVVKGADHGLMYRSSVVVDVFECLLSSWRAPPYAGMI